MLIIPVHTHQHFSAGGMPGPKLQLMESSVGGVFTLLPPFMRQVFCVSVCALCQSFLNRRIVSAAEGGQHTCNNMNTHIHTHMHTQKCAYLHACVDDDRSTRSWRLQFSLHGCRYCAGKTHDHAKRSDENRWCVSVSVSGSCACLCVHTCVCVFVHVCLCVCMHIACACNYIMSLSLCTRACI